MREKKQSIELDSRIKMVTHKLYFSNAIVQMCLDISPVHGDLWGIWKIIHLLKSRIMAAAELYFRALQSFTFSIIIIPRTTLR